MTHCNQWIGSPEQCPHPVFQSADGSTRCRGCHLHPDGCTCGERTFRILYMLGIIELAGQES